MRFTSGLGIFLSMVTLLGVSLVRTTGWAHATWRDLGLSATILVVGVYTLLVLVSMVRYGVGPLDGERQAPEPRPAPAP